MINYMYLISKARKTSSGPMEHGRPSEPKTVGSGTKGHRRPAYV
jgi:hypothetical protein